MKSDVSFGEWLRRQRRSLNLTQEGLAHQVSCALITIRKLETDERRPSLQLAQRIAECLQLSPQDTVRFLTLARVDSAADPFAPFQSNSLMTGQPEAFSSPIRTSQLRQDWNIAPDVAVFFGRHAELAQLEQWLVHDRCRLVTVLGMGGMGKTALAAKVAEQIQAKFDYVIWRSLREAPPLEEMLDQCIRFLSDQQVQNPPASVESRIQLLLDYLRQNRCLLILDNAEAIMRSGERAGHYLAGYEGYGRLLRQVGESRHQSCLLLTSREKPRELALLEGETGPVRALHLTSLATAEGKALLREQGLSGSDGSWANLTTRYSGNPLALKVVAETVRELFAGHVDAFLREDTAMFGDIQDLLAQQFARLSPLEQEIIFWLAVEREPVALDGLRANLVQTSASLEVFEALSALRRRSLLETSAAGFTLQNVVMEYMTNTLVDQVYTEVQNGTVVRFESHSLIQAQAKEYVRARQTRLILQRVADRLLAVWGKAEVEARLRDLLSMLHQTQPRPQGFTGGNIVNLLVQIKSDLRGWDFSQLAIRQAYLRNVNLQDTNLSGADLATTVFTDTFGGIDVVTFSPDGTRLVAGTSDGEIRVWQFPECQPLLGWLAHSGMLRSICFSPDGRLMASSSTDGSVRLWDAQSGQHLATLDGHSGAVRSVCFSPDGRMLAGACEDHNIYLWDVHNRHCLAKLQGHSHWVLSVSFSPDGMLLASGSYDRSVRLWEVGSLFGGGQCVRTLLPDTDMIVSICFSPDSKQLACAGRDNSLCLWDVVSGECLATLAGHTDEVGSICFSPDGHTLASSSEDLTVRLWDVGDFEGSGQCLMTLHGHSGIIRSVCFTPDSRILASGSFDQSVRLWDMGSGECVRVLEGYTGAIASVCFSPDGNLLASGNTYGTVHLWDMQDSYRLDEMAGHTEQVTSVCFTPDGHILASGSTDKSICLWDVNSGLRLATLQGHNFRVLSVCFSPNGKLLASSDAGQTLHLWDVQSRRPIQTLQGHTRWVMSVHFSPDGRTLASADIEGTLRLWDVSSGRCLHALLGHTHWVRSLCFSPDGEWLASGGYDKSVRLWDAHNGQCLATLQGHTGWVLSVCFHPNGRFLASSSEDHKVRIWQVGSRADAGECIQVLQGHTSRVDSVCFSPDGHTLASGSRDGTIKLWGLSSRSQTYECVQTLRANRPYERMKIAGVTGITVAQQAVLKALGALEEADM